jgi:hypothetical protein
MIAGQYKRDATDQADSRDVRSISRKTQIVPRDQMVIAGADGHDCSVSLQQTSTQRAHHCSALSE